MKNSRPFFTNTTKRIALWNILVILIVYLLFNVFSIIILEFQLVKNLDANIEHEMEHILHSFKIEKDSLIINNPAEFEESDLVDVTDSPFFLQVYKRDGKIILHSKNIHKFSKIPKIYPNLKGEKVFSDIEVSGNDLRAGYSNVYDENGNFYGYIQLSTLKAVTRGIEKEIILFNLFSFPVFFIFIVGISFYLAKRSYDPINKIIDLANTISATNLHQRLEYTLDKRDELGRLQDTLNMLFERLEKQVHQISNFTDNASHQLMTPLTIINTEVEYILNHKDPKDEVKESLNVLKEQTQRLIHVVKTLLLISKSQQDQQSGRTVFNLSQTIKSEIGKHHASDKITSVITDNIFAKGNKDNFLLAISNLIDNALKYSPNDKEITIRVFSKNSRIKIMVEDRGIGIPENEKKYVFERFYRTKKSINSATAGFGLGLSLVDSIISNMGGKIAIEDNTPKGTKFIITLNALRIS